MRRVNEIIYSEQFDFNILMKELGKKADRLESLLAIKFVVSSSEPVDTYLVDRALKEVLSAKEDDLNEREMKHFLNLLEEMTEISWLEKAKYILEGKLAYQENKYSYEANIYELEKLKKGPTSSLEKEKWKNWSIKMEQADKALDDYYKRHPDSKQS